MVEFRSVKMDFFSIGLTAEIAGERPIWPKTLLLGLILLKNTYFHADFPKFRLVKGIWHDHCLLLP
jgi:hypothetical protein